MPFQYHRPDNWSQAVQLLAEPGAIAKMGGCDVFTRHRMGQLNCRSIIALNRLPGVKDITHSAAGTQIGAAVTFHQIAGDQEFRTSWPVMADTFSTIASPAIRSTATIVGNIAQRWNVSDVVPLFVAAKAELQISGPGGRQRSVVVENLVAPAAALAPGEIIAMVILPAPSPNCRLVYQRFAFREAFDLPLVSIAVAASVQSDTLSDVRVAVVGGMEIPARCKPAETVLEAKSNNEETSQTAASALAAWANPVSDFRASAGYRRHLLTVMLQRALAELRSNGGREQV